MTDTVPAGLGYVSGSLNATLGVSDDSGAPLLHWSGEIGGTPIVTLTYVVTVTEASARAISNMVALDIEAGGVLTRTATVVANGHVGYLPLVSR